MPKHPVYIAMLGEAARSAIGLPHPSGRAAMRMLEDEGFAYEGFIDIFDGGPTMTARTDRVKSIAGARAARFAGADAAADQPVLAATGRLAEFRCCYALAAEGADEVALDSEAARLLGIEPGAAVWTVPR